jgi:hypothetical protein
MSQSMKKVFVNLLVLFFFLLTTSIGSFMVMVCWNFSIADYFELKDISFFQSFGFYVMLRIILDNPIRIESSEHSDKEE